MAKGPRSRGAQEGSPKPTPRTRHHFFPFFSRVAERNKRKNVSSSKKKKPGRVVFWGGDRGAFCPEGGSSSSGSSGSTGGEGETLPRDARVSDGFAAALALALSLSLWPTSRIALAAVGGHRPPVVPFGSSSASAASAAAAAVSAVDEGDVEALEAASALGEVAAGALGALRFSTARAARLVPSRAALLEASSSSAAGLKSNSAAAAAAAGASAPPLPLLQGAEQMYG